jgi:hypothetical protein
MMTRKVIPGETARDGKQLPADVITFATACSHANIFVHVSLDVLVTFRKHNGGRKTMRIFVIGGAIFFCFSFVFHFFIYYFK